LEQQERESIQRAMIALSEGDRAAFHPIFAALWPLLLRFSRRALGDAHHAEDAAQAALLKLLLHAPEFDRQRDAVAWALGFASFECLTVRNKESRRRHDSDAELLVTVPASGPTPEEIAIDRDLRSAAAEVLGSLRREDLEVLEAVVAGRRPSGPESARARIRKRVQRSIERVRVAWRSKHGTD
jgi:DNA-directed RNA polymerase specialized sigma24 family protein